MTNEQSAAPDGGSVRSEMPGSVPAADLVAAFNGLVRSSLRPLALGMAGLYVVYAISYHIVPPTDLAWQMILVSGATLAILLAVVLALAWRGLPTRGVHPLATGLFGVAALNSLLHIYLTHEPRHTTNLMLVLVGAGFFLLITRWYMTLIVGSVAGWLLVAALVPLATRWVHFGLGLTAAIILGLTLHTVRVGTLTRLEALRWLDKRRAAALQEANIAIQRSEQRLRKLSEATFEGVVIHHAGQIIDANLALAELLGYPADAFDGLAVEMLVAPESRPIVRHKLDSGEEGRFEALGLRADGERFPGEVCIKRIDYEGQVAGVVAIRDISGRKRAEQALAAEHNLLRTLIDNVPDFIYVKDTDGRYKLNNIADARAKGAEVPDAVLGKTDTDFYAAELAEQYQVDDQQVIASGEPLLNREEPIGCGGGNGQIVLTNRVPLRDMQGQVIGVVGIGRDITLRKQIEAEREQLIQELNAFAQTVAHDLKSPLGMVLGYSDILSRELESLPADTSTEYLQRIARASQKMSSIIDELLLLAQMRREDVRTEALDMAEIVDEACSRLAYLIDQTGAVITTPESWPVACGYGAWIEEVWVNYVSNAIRYGGQPPHIDLGYALDTPGMARFWVRDNGPGIAPEDQARLFTPFTQLHHVRAKGHGLGLSIVSAIMTKLGGTVGVTSELGQGSEFSFSLPLIGDTAAPDSTA